MGPPKDVEGECNAWLLLGDDYGDNVTTVRCRRPPHSNSAHQSNFRRGAAGEESVLPRLDDQVVSIVWTIDESMVCAVHGRVEGPVCSRCEVAKDEDVTP